MQHKCPSKLILIGFMVGAMAATTAMAQSAKTPPGPPGGLPGAAPMPGLPAASPPAAPEPRSLLPPAPPTQSPRDAGGPQACDCYRVINGKRVLQGKTVACCPK